ncbi:hypothetical protein GGI03_005523 [Coemansia sp. RSA 2337]|nr:hypothetical protein H4S03_006900 [Coemansia sp. S3946]KAJ2106580.1 hypothetical protein IW146_007723 [Coemansia sp. RSA 922]KAJ2430765.1 hypothetical protein GGF41_000847 [Coemansia sp. RSA 2531]KAJ2459537.1 hypothetical protein GGI03_005523 [Coemansia sp. RSA 2337]
MSFLLKDRDARKRILWGTAGLGVAGAAIGLNLAILRNLQPIRRHALTMATNWSLYGLFFLTNREAILHERLAKKESLHLRPLLSARETDEMFSSVVAGGITGGILSFITFGRRAAIFSGIGFFAVVSAAGQYSFTVWNRWRREKILRDMAGRQHGAVIESDAEGLFARMGAKMRQLLLVDPISRLPDWFPLRRLSSTEYRGILELRREEVRTELNSLRAAISAMDSREQALLSKLAAYK